MILTNQCN